MLHPSFLRRLIALLAFLSVVPVAVAQTDLRFVWATTDTLYAEHVDHFTRVDAPALPQDYGARPLPSQFQIEYVNFPEQARPAFEAAAGIWSTHIITTVPIHVRAEFSPLEENVLGSAGSGLVANFTNAPESNVWFPTALANTLANRRIFPDQVDITLTFNSQFPNWYFGTAGTPPQGAFDFVSVALHELGHGLGFAGSLRVEGGLGRWGFAPSGSAALFPVVFDVYAETDLDGITSRLLDTGRFPNPSAELQRAGTSNRMYFNGPLAVQAQVESQSAQGLPVGPGGRPKLHAPSQWRPGSSYSHLSGIPEPGQPEMYPSGSLNSLMTPSIGATEVIHTPGAVTCGMFRDMGWPMGPSCLALLPEPPEPIDEPLLVVGPAPNPATTGSVVGICVFVPEQQSVHIDVFDMMGRRVGNETRNVSAMPPAYVHDRPLCAPGIGRGYVEISTRALASGVYIVRVRTREVVQAVRMTVVH